MIIMPCVQSAKNLKEANATMTVFTNYSQGHSCSQDFSKFRTT